jgi:hypothetical protein
MNTTHDDQDHADDLTDELLRRHNDHAPNQVNLEIFAKLNIRDERIAEYIRSEGYAYQER